MIRHDGHYDGRHDAYPSVLAFCGDARRREKIVGQVSQLNGLEMPDKL